MAGKVFSPECLWVQTRYVLRIPRQLLSHQLKPLESGGFDSDDSGKRAIGGTCKVRQDRHVLVTL